MSHVTSSDSLNGRRTSSDLSRDPMSPTALGIPSTPPGGPESPRAGPEPNVVQSSSSGGSKEPGVEEDFFKSPMSNGCFTRYRTGSFRGDKTVAASTNTFCLFMVCSVDEKDGNKERGIQSNGVYHDCGEEAAACADPPNGTADGEC